MWITKITPPSVSAGAPSLTLGPVHTRGSALLAVLWLSLALSAIAFSLAATVRGETERTSTAVDGLRSYYLATGAIERAILYMQWGKQFYSPATPVLRMSFPTGEAEVEVIPEAAKYNINHSKPEDLLRLLASLGTSPDQAQNVVSAIVDWRTPGDISPFDQYYLSLVPSFRARHASFEEIEELLVLRGMTTDLYYGTYDRDAGGRLFRRGGLNECVSVYGAVDRFDANTAHPAVLASLGLSPQQVQSLVERRRRQPFLNDGDLGDYAPAAGGHLRVGGNSMFTLRATARLRLQDGKLSDMRRSVGAMVKMMPPGYDAVYQIMRWYDNAWRD
jgi:general secretion pathway protein K